VAAQNNAAHNPSLSPEGWLVFVVVRVLAKRVFIHILLAYGDGLVVNWALLGDSPLHRSVERAFGFCVLAPFMAMIKPVARPAWTEKWRK
jgi:hypothetical protein